MEAHDQSSGIKKPFVKRLQWSEQEMADAMKAVENGMTVTKAAKQYNVPRSSLRNRVLGDEAAHGVRPGGRPYLTADEEAKLVEYIIECASAGCGKTRAEIMTIVENTAREKKRLRKKKISHGWYDHFLKRRRELVMRKRNPSNICANLRNTKRSPDDKTGPIVENEAEEDNEGDPSTTHGDNTDVYKKRYEEGYDIYDEPYVRWLIVNHPDDVRNEWMKKLKDSQNDPSTTHDDNTDVYKKRYEEGYDIYDEPYVRWLIVNHPDDVRNDWMKKLKDSQKDSPMTDQIIEKVAGDVADVNEESNTAQSHSDSEDLFQRWYREGYDIYNEAYVRWLMVHHPGDVKSEWLTKTATTSKSFEPDQPSENFQSSRRKPQKKSVMETLPQSSISETPLCQRLQWSEQVVDDINATENGASITVAAREHVMQQSTRQDRVSRNDSYVVREQPKPYLTPEEETKLAEYITECISAGRRKSPTEIMTIAENAVRDKYGKKRMTKRWFFRFAKRHGLLLSKVNPSNICTGSRNVTVNPYDELRPTIEIEAEGDTERDPNTTHDDNTDVYKKRYEEGYDMYDEPYVRWLIVNYPDDVRNDWMKKLKDSQKDSAMTDQIIEKVAGDVVDVTEESNTAQSHSDSEDLFQRRYREGYDIYDEAYVRWLMVHHPGDVKSEWLTKTATTSKSFEPDQPSETSQSYRKKLTKESAMETLPQRSINKRRLRKKLWSKQAMIDAMIAVEDGMSINKAAREHNVPKSTLRGRVLSGVRPGPKLTDDEETKLTERIAQNAPAIYQETRAEAMTIAGNTACDKKKLAKDTTIHDRDAPSNAQQDTVMPDPVKHFFDLLDKSLQENNLKETPAQIYNLDEIGVAFEHQNVLTLKGQKMFKCHTSGSKKQTSVVACVNAIGQAIPPFVIYDAKALHPMWMKGGPPGTVYACRPNGWIDTELFKTWLEDHFLKFAVPARPLLLIVNGDKTHYELPIIEFARERDVFMLCLPTYASQPLDTCALKKHWNNVVHYFLTKNPGRVIWKYNFPPLFITAWEKAMTPSNIFAGFEDAGIYPYNPDKSRSTIENETEEDSERGASTTHDDSTDVYKKRYEEGYDIYDEPYVRWLIVNHPDDVRNDWMKKLKDLEKDSGMTDQTMEKLAGDVVDVTEESNTAQSHSDSEDLFQRRYREGYDIYDEAYVRWLMVHHPGDVKSEWLTKTATTSKSFEPDQPSKKSQLSRRKSQKRSTIKTHLRSITSKRPLHRKQWSEQVMGAAMKAAEGGMPVSLAATEHNVPVSTLRNRMIKKFGKEFGHDVKQQSTPYLTADEETKLAEYITECTSADRSKTSAEIMTIAENAVRDKFRKGRMSQSWFFQFAQRHNLLLSKPTPRYFKIIIVNPQQWVRPTVKIKARGNNKRGPRTTHDDNTDVYKKRYKEGYDIYDEPYVRWLIVNHPDEVRNDWMKKLKDSQKDSAITDQIIEKVAGDIVEDSDKAESHSNSEDLLQRRSRKRPQNSVEAGQCISKKRQKGGSN